jgi:hypothetical protein
MIYDQDGLRTVHNHDFMTEPAFVSAYQRGVRAAGSDYGWHWRVHAGLWAARLAIRLPGDFVECGTNRGFMSSAIMYDLDWTKTGRRFYLLDTFRGLDERYVSAEEQQGGVLERNLRDLNTGFYTTDVDAVRINFAEWENISIIVGPIPETLAQIDSDCIAFLHIDLNCSPPEVAAIRHVWERLTPGAPVLLDDYAYSGYEWQKVGMDGFARERGASILSLPTGQGLLIKPPCASSLGTDQPSYGVDLIRPDTRRVGKECTRDEAWDQVGRQTISVAPVGASAETQSKDSFPWDSSS